MSAITVENVTKQYRQYHDRPRLVRMPDLGRTRRKAEIVALDNVSFQVEPGGTVGIIGPNGSGKTTLLRLLSGVSAPTSGRLRIEGRIAPLIGVGVGFNRELTGRENVHVNGRLLGMTPEEVHERYDEIVAFSEIGEAVEAPVKFYSSGMFLRLAFSVAIHTTPDVMLVDEILAVGDVGFQSKCFERMRVLQRSGTTIVVVTHNLAVLERLTRRTLLLNGGQLVHDGPTEEALDTFHTLLLERESSEAAITATVSQIDLKPVPARVSVSVVDDDGKPTAQVAAADGCRIDILATFDAVVDGPVVGLLIERPGVGPLWLGGSDPGAYGEVHGPDKPLRASVRLPNLPLLAGSYSVRALIRPANAVDLVTARSPRHPFHVSNPSAGLGHVDLRPEITIDDEPVPSARFQTLFEDEAGEAV